MANVQRGASVYISFDLEFDAKEITNIPQVLDAKR